MAKSLRSKWRRKCRAVKRERYGKKELERLKKTLGITDSDGKIQNKDVNMSEIADIAQPTDAKNLETDAIKRVFNSKTMKDQFGTYPVWMHPRKIHKTKKIKKMKSKKKK